MKFRTLLLSLTFIFISCKKSSTSKPATLLVKYEMKFSSGIITTDPPVTPQNRFRITYITYNVDDVVSHNVYPINGITSWDTTFIVSTLKRPIELGFETTSFYLSEKGSRTTNIYIDNKNVLSKTDTTGNLNIGNGILFYYNLTQ